MGMQYLLIFVTCETTCTNEGVELRLNYSYLKLVVNVISLIIIQYIYYSIVA